MAAMASRKEKRPASSQAGPKSKKAHVEKPASDLKGKKRSKPVTAPLEHDNEDDSSAEEDLADEFEEVDEAGGDLQVGSTSQIAKDPNGAYSSSLCLCRLANDVYSCEGVTQGPKSSA